MRLLRFQRNVFEERLLKSRCICIRAYYSWEKELWKILDNMSHLTSKEEMIEAGEAIILVMHMQCERDNLSAVRWVLVILAVCTPISGFDSNPRSRANQI